MEDSVLTKNYFKLPYYYNTKEVNMDKKYLITLISIVLTIIFSVVYTNYNSPYNTCVRALNESTCAYKLGGSK